MHIACECCGVFGANAKESAEVEDFSRGEEDRLGSVGLRREGVEL